jgi:hypothetical protein
MAFGVSKTGTQTSVVEIIALAVIAGLIFWFFVRPQSTVLSTEKSNLAQSKTELQSVNEDKAKLAELTARLKKSQADIVLVDQAVPLQNRPTQIEFLLNDLVTAAGMQVTDLSFVPVENSVVAGNKALLKDPYAVSRKLQTTNLGLTVSGGTDQFKNLLELIETNGRLIDVATLDMSNEAENPVFTLKLKAYSYVP